MEVVAKRRNWAERRVFYHDPQGRLASVSTSWTDIWVPNPFVEVSAGRALFRPDDLLALGRMIDEVVSANKGKGADEV